ATPAPARSGKARSAIPHDSNTTTTRGDESPGAAGQRVSGAPPTPHAGIPMPARPAPDTDNLAALPSASGSTGREALREGARRPPPQEHGCCCLIECTDACVIERVTVTASDADL